jgi:glycine cleavage system H protein
MIYVADTWFCLSCRYSSLPFSLASQIDGDVGTIGITDFAQNSLGDIVYVEMPAIDDVFEAEESFGSVESVKAASDIYMPLGGTVIDINTELEDNPGLVNEASESEGWLVKVKLDDASAVGDLLDGAAYKDLCNAEEKK